MNTDYREPSEFTRRLAFFFYYLAILWVAIGVFPFTSGWIVTRIIHSIFGGLFFIYPFNAIRWDWGETFEGWMKMFWIMFFLTAISGIVGEALGFGGFAYI